MPVPKVVLVEGQWITGLGGRRFQISQVAGHTVYLRPRGANWDAPIARDLLEDFLIASSEVIRKR